MTYLQVSTSVAVGPLRFYVCFYTDFHVKSCLLTKLKLSVLPYESTTGLSIWHLRSDLIILHKIDIQFYLYIIDSFKAVK